MTIMSPAELVQHFSCKAAPVGWRAFLDGFAYDELGAAEVEVRARRISRLKFDFD